MTYSEKIELLSGLADLTQTILKLTKIVANIRPDSVRPTVLASQHSTLEDLKKASPEEKISVVKDFLQAYLDSDDDFDDFEDEDDEPIENTARIDLDDLKVKPASTCTSEELQRQKANRVVNCETMIPFELYQEYHYGSDIRCTRPTKDREYVRILAVCRGKFLTVKDIFPGIENPSRDELTTLQRLGYLQKYTQAQYVRKWLDGKVREARKVWFMTTPKGEELLRKVGV